MRQSKPKILPEIKRLLRILFCLHGKHEILRRNSYWLISDSTKLRAGELTVEMRRCIRCGNYSNNYISKYYTDAEIKEKN